MDIPKDWTFKSRTVAEGFDAHVREQLPWYDLVTKTVTHFGRHYIPMDGLVYDIGASTGNIGNALRPILTHRHATFIAIEESKEMAACYTGPETLVQGDATQFDYQPFDFAVIFLCLMFMPIQTRYTFLKRLVKLIRPGGCIILVDKIETDAGYYGTVTRRLAMQWKLENGASPEDILKKELSLAGYQRPLNPRDLTSVADVKPFFLFGDFAGWVIEAPK